MSAEGCPAPSLYAELYHDAKVPGARESTRRSSWHRFSPPEKADTRTGCSWMLADYSRRRLGRSAARLAALARFSLPAQRFALRAKDLSATAMVKSTCTARIFRRDQSGAPLCERKTAASEACSRSCFDAFSVSISLGKTRSVPSARVETLRCSKPSLKKQLGPQFGFPAAVICALHSQAASGAIRPPRYEAFPANR